MNELKNLKPHTHYVLIASDVETGEQIAKVETLSPESLEGQLRQVFHAVAEHEAKYDRCKVPDCEEKTVREGLCADHSAEEIENQEQKWGEIKN